MLKPNQLAPLRTSGVPVGPRITSSRVDSACTGLISGLVSNKAKARAKNIARMREADIRRCRDEDIAS